MTGDDVRDARGKLGPMWGLCRPLHMSELGRALRLQARDPGHSVRDWERGNTTVSGPASVAIVFLLAGAIPPDPLDQIITRTDLDPK